MCFLVRSGKLKGKMRFRRGCFRHLSSASHSPINASRHINMARERGRGTHTYMRTAVWGNHAIAAAVTAAVATRRKTRNGGVFAHKSKAN